MVAIVASLLLQVPPAVALASVAAVPTHTSVVPVIAATVGSGLTVITLIAVPVQPVPLVTV